MRISSRFRASLCVAAGLVLLGISPALGRADEPAKEKKEVEPASPFKPAVLVRIKALDELINDARYLIKQAGREDEAKRAEKFLQESTGPEGLHGIATTKPIGLYGTFAAKLDQSSVVLLLPIADEAAFLKTLKNHDLEPEKDKTGLYTLKVDGGPLALLGKNDVSLLFRFANGYLYGTAKLSDKITLPEKDKLPLPATVLAGGSGVLSLTANIDRLPNQIRKLGISAAALTLGNLKDEEQEGVTEGQKALRGAILDEAAALVKSVLQEGGAVMLKLDVDRKKHDLSLSMSLEGKSGSDLAKNLAALGTQQSIAAALMSKDSAVGGYLHLMLPARIRKVLGPAVDDSIKKALDLLDEAPRSLAEPLADAFKPTLKSGTLDMGLAVRGPSKSGKYTLVGSLQVKDGEGIEKAIRKVVDKIPDEEKKLFKLDVGKAEGVAIHRVEPKDQDEFSRELLGDGPFYFAIRKDVILIVGGDQALETIKDALAAKAKIGRPLQVELSLNRAAKVLEKQHKAAPAIAKKVFTKEGSDKVRLTISGGKKLEAKLSLKTAVIAFGSLLDKAKKAEADK